MKPLGAVLGRAVLGRAVLAGLIVLATTFAMQVSTAEPAAALSCGPATSSRVAVAVVVDFGDSSPEGNCVALPRTSSGTTTSTGIDALRAAGYSLRIEGGFLCAIDGKPATGCATGSGFDGWYWRYFKAQPDKAWVYSSVGFGYRIAVTNGCAAEGWVWSGSLDASGVRGGVPLLNCSAQPSPTTTQAPTPPNPPATTPGSPAGGFGGTPGGGTPSSGDPSVGQAQPLSGATPGVVAPAGSSVSGTEAKGAADTAPSAGESQDTSVGDPATAPGADRDAEVRGAASEFDRDGNAQQDSAGQFDAESAGAKRRSEGADTGSGSALGSAFAAVLVVALALVAVWKIRARGALGN